MSRHLHFVQSTEPLQGGGLGKAALELSAALKVAGEQSCLVATGAGSTTGDECTRIYRRSGPERLFYSPALRRDAYKLVAAADIIHGHGFYVGTNWLLGRQARAQAKPLVYHAHGIFEPWILARSRRKKAMAHFLFESANFRHASLWRALTSKEADQIRRQGVNAPIVVCPNGIEISQFERISSLRVAEAKHKESYELLFLARIHPKKGLLLLVEAWATLPAKLRDKWTVVVAGPDELGHRAEVESAVAAAGASNQWRFVGTVSGLEKLKVLARADAFVLPSHSEGFSVAILEAMACRLPVLATQACNFPALAERGGGWSVPTNVPALSAALVDLLTEKDSARAQRGVAARKLVEAEYTWSNIAAKISQACLQLIKN